ncbi:MAG: hypothetical protein P8L40_02675 [Planktomarina sp.]|nr:hypothetical protein [Planktomarina sp.]
MQKLAGEGYVDLTQNKSAKGTLHGMLAAELASEHSSGLLSNIMTQAEPKRLPSSPIAWLGVNVLLKCGEFKAGADL